MLMYSARRRVLVSAPPDAVFRIVSDIERHPQLAGSGEVLRLRKVTDGPVRMGTRFEADEDIRMGPSRTKFTAASEVVVFDAPKVFSWTSMPPGSPKPKRIQWWFRLTPEGTGTRVSHEVEADMGLVANLLMKCPYYLMRGRRIGKGMQRTLANVKREAEHQGRPA